MHLQVFEKAHEAGKLGLDSIDFGKRRAVERELEASGALDAQKAVFDESGHFLLYPTLLGIKVCLYALDVHVI
jgi:peptidylprolyl isomerase domain and WD repeat-containing protein 1